MTNSPSRSKISSSNIPSGKSVPSQRKRARPFQISLRVILLLTGVFALMSMGMMHALRVEAVREELSMIFGLNFQPNQNARTPRQAHIQFILFTLMSPLLLAGAMSIGISVLRRARQPR